MVLRSHCVARWAIGGLLVALACSGAVHAELAGDDYQTRAAPLTDAERRQRERQLRAEQERQAAAERAAAERRRRLQEALAAWRAARPPGAQLVEQRCTRCHTADVIQPASRGTVGWLWTVARMRLHGADIDVAQALTVARYLAERGAANRPALDAPPDEATLLSMPRPPPQ